MNGFEKYVQIQKVYNVLSLPGLKTHTLSFMSGTHPSLLTHAVSVALTLCLFLRC